jgi:hypothetical protein
MSNNGCDISKSAKNNFSKLKGYIAFGNPKTE